MSDLIYTAYGYGLVSVLRSKVGRQSSDISISIICTATNSRSQFGLECYMQNDCDINLSADVGICAFFHLKIVDGIIEKSDMKRMAAVFCDLRNANQVGTTAQVVLLLLWTAARI